MEENREQPTMEPANVINITEEERAVSEVGSQGAYGKFKSAEKLLEAYNNLQSGERVYQKVPIAKRVAKR